uniref:LRRCT domain-containing protein n=1 Tax=Rhabditophanes sp. KR3021 TaxID=114890 RepID=A0AC35TIZ8_9BILA
MEKLFVILLAVTTLQPFSISATSACADIDLVLNQEKTKPPACRCYAQHQPFLKVSTAIQTDQLNSWIGCTELTMPGIVHALTSFNKTIETNIWIWNSFLTIIPPNMFDQIRPRVLSIENSSLSIIKAGALTSVSPFVHTLILKNNIIKSIDKNVFDNLNSLKHFDVSGNKLSTLSRTMKDSFPAVEEFILNDNHISMIEDGFFDNLGRLKKLNLANNRLQALGKDTFKGLVNLEYLNLKGNLLKTINSSTFGYLKKLETLHLDGNALISIDLSDLRSLKKLFINSNHIESFKDIKLSKLTNLVYLNVDDNDITAIDNLDLVTLKESPKLRYISFAQNNISTVSPKAFEHVKELKVLSFTGNNIVSIGGYESFLKPLKSLETLLLSKNLIESVDKSDFDGLRGLKNLALDFNNISDIMENTFDGINLEKMFINRNDLNKLPDGIFDHLEKTLKVVDLSDNPWSTLCKDSKLSLWIGRIGKANVPSGDITNLMSKCIEEENVENEKTSLIITVIASILAFLCLVILVAIGFLYYDNQKHPLPMNTQLKHLPSDLIKLVNEFKRKRGIAIHEAELKAAELKAKKPIIRPLSTIYETDNLLVDPAESIPLEEVASTNDAPGTFNNVV